jgi:phenylalanyl-tRNA synthetase alpha chain
LRAQFDTALAAVTSAADLQVVRDRFLGRKNGLVTALYAEIGTAPAEQKREIGRLADELKAAVEAGLEACKNGLGSAERLPGVDLTLAPRTLPVGSRHPLNAMRERIERIFVRMGYEILDGPEAEDDWHNFEALNMPDEHPARDMQDTLYLAEPLPPSLQPPTAATTTRPGRRPAAPQPLTLLRTHTSAMQIRHMEQHDPPVRLVAIGPVYRRDNLDLTHTPMFHQCEGLVVGHGITLAHLKGTLLAMAEALFGAGTPVRFRPSFFPYTEPSAEVDVGCIRCGGVGCPVCKHTGWLEILGSGMVHPAVFEAVGYDPATVTGFAFGMGIERVAMLKWDVGDIRLFYENDLRFLGQFSK